jgi:hypothetical protein
MNPRDRLDLQLIDRYIERQIAKNGGAYPDWMRALDLWTLQALAEGAQSNLDHQRDVDTYREEMSLGGEHYDPMEQQKQSGGR